MDTTDSRWHHSITPDYFKLQIMFATVVAQKTGENLSHTLFTHTGLYRRFGLGNLDERNPVWQEYIANLVFTDILGYTYRFYLDRMNDDAYDDKKFGCFSFHSEGTVMRIHFSNRYKTDRSPLSEKRISARTRELTRMFEYVRRHVPEIKTVQGCSWLYNLERYCRLFPEQYTREKRVETNYFQSSALWGQFLRHNRSVKEDLSKRFLEKLTAVDEKNLLSIFPYQVLRVEESIDVFYDFYKLR